jgi:hypothetical protein
MPGHVDDVTTDGVGGISVERPHQGAGGAARPSPCRHPHHAWAGADQASGSVGSDQNVPGQRFRKGNLSANLERAEGQVRNPVRFSL